MSKIQWTGTTHWNPIVGCSVTSPGCTRCYAMSMAARIERMGGKAAAKYRGSTRKTKAGPVWTGMVRLDGAALSIPLTWRRGRLAFVNSMSDLFHEALSASDIDQVFAIMALCGQHTFQVLTKRPDRMRDYLNDPATRSRVELRAAMIKPGFRIQTWPLPHIWCGTSIEDQVRANERLPILLETQAAVRFVSIEPLLGHVALGRAARAAALKPQIGGEGLHWIIVGGESGGKARPMHPDWARSLRDEAITLGIPLFYKQHGQFSESDIGGKRRKIGLMPNGQQVPAGTPGSVTLWNLGKKADDQLDEQTWHQFPTGWAAPAPKLPPKRRQSHRSSDGAGRRLGD